MMRMFVVSHDLYQRIICQKLPLSGERIALNGQVSPMGLLDSFDRKIWAVTSKRASSKARENHPSGHLPALARDTKHVRVGQIVTCNSYRNPALVAKMASTLDVLSHGRLNFGIGAGWYEHEYRAYGYPFPDGPERLRQLREALQVIHAMWEQEEATFEGQYYHVRGAINQPKGVQKPHIPILIGGSGEKVTLKLVAQYGDACNVSGDLKTLEHKFAVLKQHCQSVGRDYESIYRTTSAFCSIADSDEEALALIPDIYKPELRETSLVGSPATIRQRIAALEALGVQEIIMDLPSATDLTPLYRFAREFMA
jgi:F420-dependent oxidoreductase-like protein